MGPLTFLGNRSDLHKTSLAVRKLAIDEGCTRVIELVQACGSGEQTGGPSPVEHGPTVNADLVFASKLAERLYDCMV